MKHLLIALALISSAAQAHMITGQSVLKGTAKTKIQFMGEEARCSIKVDEVKNNLVEDQFGNPAYYVWTKVELSSSLSSAAPFSHKLEVRFTNIHRTADGSMVRDDFYVGEDSPRSQMTINEKGRIKQIVFPVGAKLVTCNF